MKSRTLRPVRSSGEAGVAAEAVADSEAYVDSRVEADFEAEQDYDPEQTYVHRHRAGGAGLRGAGLREAGPREASDDDDIVEVSVFGRVAAGLPAQALEQRIDTVRIDRMMLGGRGHVFGLRITGDSMIEAGIFDGDYVFVRKQIEAPEGAIVVCLVGDEATCKRFYPEKHHIRLEPANAQMASILIPKTDWRETRILGVVVGVYRKL
jgi:repressor LexA